MPPSLPLAPDARHVRLALGLAVAGVLVACALRTGPAGPPVPAASPTTAWTPPECAQPIAGALGLDAPGTGTYSAPGAAARAHLGAALEALAAGSWTAAQAGAEAAGYRLCLGRGGVALLLPHDRAHARIALRTGAAAPLVFEVPHPYHDRGTADQGLFLFEELGARALVVSGTHRCANSRSVCRGGDDYPESDMARNVESFFQQAHASLLEAYPEVVGVSLHGMARHGVSVSNGTRLPTTPSSPVARLTRALSVELADEQVTTCNGFSGAEVRYHLCGTSNVQGWLANGHAQVSPSRPGRPGSRFIHLEQARRVRRHPLPVARAFQRWLEVL